MEYGPATLCRMDDAVVSGIGAVDSESRIMVGAALTVLVGTVSYGFVFGIWRCELQALYSAIKLPLLFFSTVLSSALINTMLAQVLGARLTFRQTCLAMLAGMAITAAVLGAFSPVMLLFSLQMPAGVTAMQTYWSLLVAHVVVIAVAGIVGNVKLYGLILRLTGNRDMAVRLMVSWIAVIGLVGSELSWLASPFLARPDLPVPFLNPNAFKSNFFEYLGWAMSGLFL